jgi:hypothetical protein
MRIGPLEIVLIVVVVIAVALVARIARLGRVPAGRSAKRTGASRTFYQRTGTALIIVGAIALAVAASLFRWALQGYLWALLIIAGGTALLLLGRRKG